MKQFYSSKELVEKGLSRLNCNFNMGLDIIVPIAYKAMLEKKISYDRYEKIKKNANSRLSFTAIDNFLDCSILPIKTAHGNIVNIARGVSKTALIIDNGSFQFVIKYNRYAIKASELETFKLPRLNDCINDRFHQQVLSQVAVYDKLAHDTAICEHLLKPFRYYERYNCTIEPFAENVGNCDWVNAEALKAFKSLVCRYGIGDMHGQNYGIYKGKYVAIDYGL